MEGPVPKVPRRVALGGGEGLKCMLGMCRGSGDGHGSPAGAGDSPEANAHHGQSHHNEAQHAGPEQGPLREVAAQPPDDQALNDLGRRGRGGGRWWEGSGPGAPPQLGTSLGVPSQP